MYAAFVVAWLNVEMGYFQQIPNIYSRLNHNYQRLELDWSLPYK